MVPSKPLARSDCAHRSPASEAPTMATRSTPRRYGARMRRLVVVLVTLFACGGGGLPASKTCDHVAPGGAGRRSAPPPGAPLKPVAAEEQASGARLVFCADLADP